MRLWGRQWPPLVGVALGFTAGCSVIDEITEKDDYISSHYARADASPDRADEIPLDHIEPVDFDLHVEERRGCSMFGAGSLTTDSIGPDVPHGSQLPFKHVVVLVQENRSFDHYLSELTLPGVDVASPQATNPKGPIGPGSDLVHRTHDDASCESSDLDHEWEASHVQYDHGLMDGFVVTNQPGGERAMHYYGQRDIPYYYWLATTFGIGDRHFCSLLGPTWPNRFYALAATSAGCTYTPDSGSKQVACETVPSTSIFDRLDGSATFKIYTGFGHPLCINGGCLYPSLSAVMLRNPRLPAAPIEDFYTDASAGALPQLSFLEPHFDFDSEHAPNNVRRGEALVRKIVEAIGSRDDVWQTTVLFVVHDEHGGFYDHVPPPRACEPDSFRPPTYAFDRLGFRVPLFVVSAYNRPGYVSHFITDHTSILRFIENLFDVGALTQRDANAWPLLDRFDCTHMTFPKLPTDAPAEAPVPDSGCP